MTDKPHRSSDERHQSPIFVPAVPQLGHGFHRRPWWRRHSKGTFIGLALLAAVICACFVYAFRIEAARETDTAHATR